MPPKAMTGVAECIKAGTIRGRELERGDISPTFNAPVGVRGKIYTFRFWVGLDW
jgi:hypothetical protein